MAFSVAFIGGCAAHAAEADDATNSDGTDPASTEADLSSKKTKKPPCHEDASAPKLSCEQLIAAAFPTEGHYPGKKQNVSAEVQTCCEESLTDHDGGFFSTTHRWDCCANLPADAGDNVGIACTPWGPPVPPSMKRRAISAPSLQAVA